MRHEMRRKGGLTHHFPLSKVDLSIVVLVRFIDQFEKVRHNRCFKLSGRQQGVVTEGP
jgi:hypothetical protein